MRTKLLIAVTCAAFLAFLFAANGEPVPAAGTSASLPQTGEGQLLVRQAQETLQRHYSVSAKIEQRSHLFGHHVIGVGTYFEQRSNQSLRFRLELNVQTTDDKLASGLLQVCDGQYLWNYRNLRGSESLSRVDFALVQQRLDESGDQNVHLLDAWPGLGGLPKLLRSFDKAFVFDKPEGVQLQADFPAWKVEGRWRPEMLARAVPAHKEAIEQGRGVELKDLPEHLPNSVILFLGEEDLFPYSIVFYRLDGSTAQVKASPDDPPMVRIIMKNVRFNQTIRPAQFIYDPGPNRAEDRTQQMLDKLGLDE